MEWNIKKELSFACLIVDIKQIGEDFCIILQGGNRPHIGSTVLSVPRPSLTGNGEVSVTSSVLNITGHKDEKICRYLAEQTAKYKNAVVTCTGGFHVDNITGEQLQEVQDCMESIWEEIREKLK